MALKGAIVGTGFFAGFQAEGWQRISGVEIVAAADPDRAKAGAFAARFGIPRVYESQKELLAAEKVDFVDIATRPETHRDLVEEAAARGVAVICQKPLAPSMADCEAMVSACARAGARLIVHENFRFQPWFREVKRRIAEGAVGELKHLAFHFRTGDGRGGAPYEQQPYFREMPRLLVYETLVHHLDVFRMLGGEIAAVTCRLSRWNPGIRGEDAATILIDFASGTTGLIDGNRTAGPDVQTPAMGVMTAEGDKGVLRLDYDGSLYLRRWQEAERQLPFAPPAQGYRGDSVWAAQAHFAHCLAAGEPVETEGRDYLRTVAAMEACYASAQQGRRQTLEGFG